MPSFDIVVKTDLQEVENAIHQVSKELEQRFDFKGSKSKVDWDKKKLITLIGDDDYKLNAVLDILKTKLVKRGVSIRNMEYGTAISSAEGTLKQIITIAEGIPTEKAKSLMKTIRDAKLKVQSQIQDAQIRVTGKKRDDLQDVMSLVKKTDIGLDFQFINLRD